MSESGPGMGMGGGRFMRSMGLRERDKPTKITKELVIRAIKCFLPYWKYMAASLICIIATSMLGLIPPMMTGRIIDDALENRSMEVLVYSILLSFGATTASSAINVLETYINTWVSKHITFDMRNKMYKHLEHMPFSFFITEKQGEIITRLNGDIGGVESVLGGTVTSLLSNIIIFISTAVMMFMMNWKLALIGLVLLPLFVLPAKRVGKFRFNIALKTQEQSSKLNQVVQDTMNVGGNLLMKLFARENDEYERYRTLSGNVMKLQIKEGMAGRWFWMTLRILNTMGPMSIYLFGGMILIYSGGTELTAGAIVTFVSLLNRLYGPVMSISSIQVEFTRAMALFERIFDYFDRENNVKDLPGAVEAPAFRGELELRDLHFSYNDKAEVLRGIGFCANPGTVTALVGPSGAGKSTIINLIPRLYDPSSGSVNIDGKDIRGFTLRSLRRQIGMVTQESHMFNGTVRENLLYSRPDATEQEMIEACKNAQILEVIEALPDRFDTFIGNGGYKLSGGEKQRLSIARVLLYDPRIVILDEATSSLDTISEAAIQKAFAHLLKGRTAIIIAHRLSTIEAADNIIVLEKGNIIQAGTHGELLEQDGLYRDLYQRKFCRGSFGSAETEESGDAGQADIGEAETASAAEGPEEWGAARPPRSAPGEIRRGKGPRDMD